MPPVPWLASWRWLVAAVTGVATLTLLVVAAASPHTVLGSGRPTALTSSVGPSSSDLSGASASSVIAPTVSGPAQAPAAASGPTSSTPTTATPSPNPSTPTAPRATTSVAPPAAPTSRAPVAAPAPAGPISEQALFASAVLNTLNDERTQNGLPPLAANATLVGTAHAHNLRMAASNTMSHQLSGEAALGARITAAGYAWQSCGENIGWTTNRTQSGIVAIEVQMYNETPPDDGHRLNILSSSFTQVGVDVILDSATGRLWLTEDFGQPVR
jgi:uncharacterized protein YkwD